MRRSALFLAFAVALTSFVGLVNPAAYAAATTLTASNTNPFVGQEVVMSGNVGVPGARTVVLEATKTGGGWVVMRTITSAPDGAISFQIATTIAQRSYRARAGSIAASTPAIVIKTKSVESAPKTATLKATPKKPYAYQSFDITGSAGSAGANRPVILQGKSGSSWVASRSGTTDGDGKYTFTLATALDRDFRILVPSYKLDGPLLSEPLTVEAKKNSVALILNRVGSKIVADGYLSADQPGRRVDLQRATSVWTTVATAQQDDNNHVEFNGSLESSRNYRLVARVSEDGAPQIISPMSALTKGPGTLGSSRVTYIQTRSGVTPTKRGVDYAATIQLAGLTATLETVAVRGNSSADFKKQGYKIKFDDDQKPLGLPEGKTFNLLPNLQDHSLLRSAVAFTTAQKLGGLRWTPGTVFTELYLNGKYRGSYELVESIKIETPDKRSARVNISPTTGVIMEFDHKPETALYSFKLPRSGNYIKFKDPDEQKTGDEYQEGITGAKVSAMKSRLKGFESILYGSNSYDTWAKYLDMDAAADFYLYSEFVKNWDGDFFASVFVYTNDYRTSSSKLVLSPVWDPDRTAGAKTSGTSNVTSPQGWWMNGQGGGHLNQSGDVHTKHWMTRLTKNATFMAKVKQRWDVNQKAFAAAGYSTTANLRAELTDRAASNDRALWQGYNPLGRYGPRAGSFAGEVGFIQSWYRARYNWMNARLEKN